MKLIYRSKALPITIENYIASSFEYDKWVISDYYKKVAIGYEYGFIVTTKEDAIDCNSLSMLALYTSNFVEKLTMLIKYAVGVSLNAPHKQVVHRRFRAIDVKELPKGWNSNYKEIDDHLQNTLTSYISVTPFPRNAKMEISALEELKTALENYDGLNDKMKDLIAIHNSAVEADERACYLILGKVLEIINSLYPYKNSNHGKDKRINTFFPELLPLFGKVTIKDLMGMANNRKETRHYVAGCNVHTSLTTIEAENYFLRIDALALQVIRKALCLPSVIISTEQIE